LFSFTLNPVYDVFVTCKWVTRYKRRDSVRQLIRSLFSHASDVQIAIDPQVGGRNVAQISALDAPHRLRVTGSGNRGGSENTDERQQQSRRFSYSTRTASARPDATETPQFGHLSNTRFALAPARPDGDRKLIEARMALPDAFTPSRPTSWGPGFIGRKDELRRVIGVIEDELAHVAIYGERGQGKTSLAHAISDLAARAGFQVAYIGCGTELGFEDIFRRAFRSLASGGAYSSSVVVTGGNRQTTSIEDLLPDGPLRPVDVAIVVSRLRGAQMILLLDDFDRASSATRRDVNELMKRISDLSGRMTIVVLGCGSRIDQLLDDEVSARTAIGLELPRMKDEEIAKIVVGGAARIGISCTEDVIAAIIEHSRGSPYAAHLLALYATRQGLQHGDLRIDTSHLEAGLAVIRREVPRALPTPHRDARVGVDEVPVLVSGKSTGARESGGDFRYG
jgi:Cdc6-like AAA superfamily ATPase